jgi:hypothetical protein
MATFAGKTRGHAVLEFIIKGVIPWSHRKNDGPTQFSSITLRNHQLTVSDIQRTNQTGST